MSEFRLVSRSELPKKTYLMHENLEGIFFSVLQQDDISGAIDFVNAMGSQYIPSCRILHTIIFDILMKNDNVQVLVEAKAYLINILRVYPPKDDESRNYYCNALQNNSGVLSDLWTVLSHVVNSCFCKAGYSEPYADCESLSVIRYPNCNLLLDLYVNVFVEEFEYSSKRISQGNCKEFLLARLFWPESDIGASKTRTAKLLDWINNTLPTSGRKLHSELLTCLCELLCLIIKCSIQWKENVSDIEALSTTCLTNILDDIMVFCKAAFTREENFSIFMSLIPLKYLQARIASKVINAILYGSDAEDFSLTLRKIVDEFMHPPFSKLKNSSSSDVRCEDGACQESEVAAISIGSSFLRISVNDASHTPVISGKSNHVKESDTFECKDIPSIPFCSASQNIPICDSSEKYGIYLHALHLLLSDYNFIFQLYKFIFENPPPIIKYHSVGACFHYEITNNKEAVCSDDVLMIKRMPGLVNDFIKSVIKHAKEVGFNVNVHIISLECYASSLIT